MVSLSRERLDSLRQSFHQGLLDRLAEALLDCASLDQFKTPVLRLDAFVQEGDLDAMSNGEPALVSSQVLDLPGILTTRKPPPAPAPSHALPTSQDDGSVDPNHDGGLSQGATSSVAASVNRENGPSRSPAGLDDSRRVFSALRPAPDYDVIDTHRQMEVATNNFPKRAKAQPTSVLAPEQPTLSKFVTVLWEQIHSSVTLEPQLLQGQAMLSSVSRQSTPEKNAVAPNNSREDPSSDYTAISSTTAGSVSAINVFSHSNIVCRRVTQASRTCRSVEVIVQARWIEGFDEYVECLGVSNPNMSQTKCRKVALMEACRDFNWSEKELRNKMAVWRSYKDVKDAAGWAALVFSGMGLYRLCKYRIGLNQKGFETLRRLKPRIEVAADTLHPQWRNLLAFVGKDTARAFTGHPHDWAVRLDGSNPVPLRSTYMGSDPFFVFEHMEESVVDTLLWDDDDPRYVPPLSAAAPVADCRGCGNAQSNDPMQNQCWCFPSLFGGPRRPAAVQVFRTLDGRNNGLQALTLVERGMAIGEFVGLVTKGVEDLDVMKASTGVRSYQIWQGRQGNYTRFINHSCNPNAQFQYFVWLGIQRIILVSKGIEAGGEITVDYSESYWSGLNKRCLCGESCCRYRQT